MGGPIPREAPGDRSEGEFRQESLETRQRHPQPGRMTKPPEQRGARQGLVDIGLPRAEMQDSRGALGRARADGTTGHREGQESERLAARIR